jgi:hypothetical protein
MSLSADMWQNEPPDREPGCAITSRAGERRGMNHIFRVSHETSVRLQEVILLHMYTNLI